MPGRWSRPWACIPTISGGYNMLGTQTAIPKSLGCTWGHEEPFETLAPWPILVRPSASSPKHRAPPQVGVATLGPGRMRRALEAGVCLLSGSGTFGCLSMASTFTSLSLVPFLSHGAGDTQFTGWLLWGASPSLRLLHFPALHGADTPELSHVQ